MEKLRKTEVHKILIRKRDSDRDSDEACLKELEEVILKEFIDYFFQENKYCTQKDNKHTIKRKDICYYIDDIIDEGNVKKVKLKYIKFNKRTNIVNVETLSAQYVKNKNEGDEEKQHYLIKIFENTNRAVLIWEKVIGATTIGDFKNDLNKSFKEWIGKYKNDKKEKLQQYYIAVEIVPSPEFVEELMKLEKISLVKVIVDKESLTNDEDILFSEENVSRDEVEVTYKPRQTLSFSKNKVKNYYNKFENQNGNTKIKRIVIQGRKDKNAIRLDTEGMKLSEYIDAKIDIDGLIDTDSIFEKYIKLVNENFKEYFNNIFLDIEESEE